MLTTSATVVVTGFVTINVFDDEFNHEPVYGYPVAMTTGTVPAFAGLYAKSMSRKGNWQDARPVQIQDTPYVDLCGVYAILDEGEETDREVSTWAASASFDICHDAMVVEDSELLLFDLYVVAVQDIVLLEENPDLVPLIEADEAAIWEALSARPDEVMQRARDLEGHLKSAIALNSVIAQQHRDWNAMLQWKEDECSRSQLQPLARQY